MKKTLFLYVTSMMLFSVSIIAQTLGDEDGPPPPPDEALPIDNYLPLLIVAGICFASFVIYKRIKVSRGTL